MRFPVLLVTAFNRTILLPFTLLRELVATITAIYFLFLAFLSCHNKLGANAS